MNTNEAVLRQTCIDHLALIKRLESHVAIRVWRALLLGLQVIQVKFTSAYFTWDAVAVFCILYDISFVAKFKMLSASCLNRLFNRITVAFLRTYVQSGLFLMGWKPGKSEILRIQSLFLGYFEFVTNNGGIAWIHLVSSIEFKLVDWHYVFKTHDVATRCAFLLSVNHQRLLEFA